jgi:hypothetical protein
VTFGKGGNEVNSLYWQYNEVTLGKGGNDVNCGLR